MKLRPIQLVCLALLLATLRLADPAAMAPGDLAFRAGCLNFLLSSEPSQASIREAAPARTARPIPVPAIAPGHAPESVSAAARALLTEPRSMAPPAGQSAAVQSVTGFGRA